MILRQGDLVVYHRETLTLNNWGFIGGRSYPIKVDANYVYVVNGPVSVPLFDSNEEPSQHADSFKKDRASKLPRGNQ